MGYYTCLLVLLWIKSNHEKTDAPGTYELLWEHTQLVVKRDAQINVFPGREDLGIENIEYYSPHGKH